MNSNRICPKLYSLALITLLFASSAKAQDLIGTIQISANTYAREGTAPATGTLSETESTLYAMMGAHWDSVRCSASAWEFSEGEFAAEQCPEPFTLAEVPPFDLRRGMMPFSHFRIPALQSASDWQGVHKNKTTPIQFLNDYEMEVSLFQFTVQVEGAFANGAFPYDVVSRATAISTIGDIKLFASFIFPYGWLPADGRSLSKDEYPELYKAIGDRYTDEISEGQSTFDLPLLSTAVIFHDGSYKRLTPLIRAKTDAYATEQFFIGDIIISANPNRPLELNTPRPTRFTPIDEKQRTVPINLNHSLYALLGNRFGPDPERYKNVILPRIALKPDAGDLDQVFFFLVTQGTYPLPP